MTAARTTPYAPVDRLYLWLLAQPPQPVPVGELNLVRATQGVSLRYADAWLRDGFPQVRVGEEESDSTLSNALTMSRLFSLDRDAAIEEVRRVASVVDRWKEHFHACGVRRGDIDFHADQIDRPFLLDQRKEFLTAGTR